jgi:hypothetical protein
VASHKLILLGGENATASARAVMAPIHFRDARLHARHHIFGKITERSGNCIRVKVKRVFRGDLRARVDTGASRLRLPERRASNMGSTLYVKGSTVSRARYVEAFLAGEPPEVVRDQIKFFQRKWLWRPSGDPSQESFLW